VAWGYWAIWHFKKHHLECIFHEMEDMLCRIKAGMARQKRVRHVKTVSATRGADDFKEKLEEFDICIIKVDGTTRGATDKQGIPVMDAWVVPFTSPTVKVRLPIGTNAWARLDT
jgi:hypothetical protein